MAGRRGQGSADLNARVDAVVAALRDGAFDPQHGGPVYLRADAAAAVRDALGQAAEVVVAGEGKAELAGAGFMGMRTWPDLAVFAPGRAPQAAVVGAPLDLFADAPRPRGAQSAGEIAVTITLLRQDARPAQAAIADAVLLATRYEAVVLLVLDRRLGGRDPFGGAGEGTGLSGADRRLVEVLARDHGITVVVRRQDPFGIA